MSSSSLFNLDVTVWTSFRAGAGAGAGAGTGAGAGAGAGTGAGAGVCPPRPFRPFRTLRDRRDLPARNSGTRLGVSVVLRYGAAKVAAVAGASLLPAASGTSTVLFVIVGIFIIALSLPLPFVK